MLYKVRYRPAFAALFVTLNPGEKLAVKTGNITSMDVGLSVQTRHLESRFSTLLKILLRQKIAYIHLLQNQSTGPATVVLSPVMFGDIERLDVSEGQICVATGAYLAHTDGLSVSRHWAGFASWLAGEGLWKLKFIGRGRVFIGACGEIDKKTIYGDFFVNRGYLIAHSSQLRFKPHKNGDCVGWLLSVKSQKKQRTHGLTIYLQSRQLEGLVHYLRSLV